ncbi:MAG: helix-turn-helix domain-containing protein [Mediterraneibacter faecis]
MSRLHELYMHHHSSSSFSFTDLTMDEISVEVGMDSANYFSRAFHKVEGISLSEYRKQW